MNAPESAASIDVTGDAELVAACLSGDREAFGRIVERYQRLLCSLAYSATGRLSESEDLAQEAFVDAWRQLSQLREPEKLRPWLCGILRHKVGRLRRDEGREPLRQSEGIEAAEGLASVEEPAAEQAIEKEEQAILWKALERVPELYREPLGLYYREQRSIEHVAVALDLTEDAVKQRLSRGRKILQERVMTFVEGALARSTPGRVFTLGVLAALPEFAPAKAAGFGAVAAQGGMLAKSTSIAALVASISGVVSAVLTLRTNLDQARTPRERRAVVKITLAAFFGALGFLAVLWLSRTAAIRWPESRVVLASVSQALVLAFVIVWPAGLVGVMRRMRALRSSERRRRPELFRDPRDQVGSAAGVYRSRWSLLGAPLVHIRYSAPDENEGPIVGWFAGGDRAYGLVFAWGGLAVAPVSVGAISVGLLTIGSVSVGVISVGTVAVGLLAVGCASIGVKAFGWLSALGGETAASGGFSVARSAAVGPVAFAPHANDPVAHQLLTDPNAAENHLVLLMVVTIVSIIPIASYAHAVRKRLGRRSNPHNPH